MMISPSPGPARAILEVDDRLVDGLLQLKGRLHRIQRRSPFVLLRTRNVLQDDATAARVLVLHELLGVLGFFGGGLLEVLGEAGKGDVIAVEVERHRQIHVMRVQLHVHLLVDAGLAFLVEVLTNNRSHLGVAYRVQLR